MWGRGGSNGYFKENYNFPRLRVGGQHFQGDPTFSRGGVDPRMQLIVLFVCQEKIVAGIFLLCMFIVCLDF